MNGMRHPAGRPRLLTGFRGVRLAWRIGAPAVAAAAIGTALVSSHLAGIAGGQPAPPSRGAEIDARAGAAPQAPPGAAQVLRLAARHAAATPAMDARPNQFLFIDSVEIESRTDLREGRDGRLESGETTVSGPLRTRTWLSVDGTRDGLIIQDTAGRAPTRTRIDGCRNGRQAQTIDRPETTPQVACTAEPAYRPGRVPTDAAGLLAYVRAKAAAEPEWVSLGAGPDGKSGGFVRLSADQRAFTEIAEILYRNHLPAVQQAAFLAAGRIAGVRVHPDVTDAAGRAGVAVTRTEAGTRQELVFDPATHRYLGHNIIGAALDLTGATVVRAPSRGEGAGRIQLEPLPKPGAVVYKSALLGIAVVDGAGQRP
jgi:hypothetical protein